MSKYDKQRPKVEPPSVPLVAVRNALGLTQTEVCAEVSRLLGHTYTKGALSALENGHRGASAETLRAIEVALGLRDGDIETSWTPSHSRRPAGEGEAIPA